jgi:hypothetical protein
MDQTIGLRILAGALFLAGCGSPFDVHDRKAPDDNRSFVRVYRQLDPEEKLVFSEWWNLRAEKVRRGTAAPSDFDLSVGEAIEQTIAGRSERRAEAEAQEDCVNNMLEEARNSTATWSPGRC